MRNPSESNSAPSKPTPPTLPGSLTPQGQPTQPARRILAPRLGLVGPLFIGLAFLIIFTVTALIVGQFGRANLDQTIQTSTRPAAISLSRLVGEPLSTFDFAQINRLLRENVRDTNIVYASIRDAQGNLIAQFGEIGLTNIEQDKARAIQTRQNAGTTEIQDPDYFQIFNPIRFENNITGVVHLIATKAPFQTEYNRTREAIVYTFITSLVIATVGFVLVTRAYVVRPLQQLSNVAEAIGAGVLDVGVEQSGFYETQSLGLAVAQMRNQIRSSYATLEERVASRTEELAARTRQLQTIAEISSEITAQRSLDTLLTDVTFLLSDRFGFYHVGIFLLDESQEFAQLRAANSEGGQRMLARQHQLRVARGAQAGQGLVGSVAGTGTARIALDVGQDAVFFNNPDLPETRSEVALPLISSSGILGVLDIQSQQPSAFQEADIELFRLVADQLAIALENAALFTQNQAALQQSETALATLNAYYGEITRTAWQNVLSRAENVAFTANRAGVRPAAPLVPTQEDQTQNPLVVEVPVNIRGNQAGVIRLKKAPPQTSALTMPTSRRGSPWNPEEMQALETLANQLGESLESARLFDETRGALLRTQALFQVSEAAMSSGVEQIPTLLQTTVDAVARTLPADRVALVTFDQPTQKVQDYFTGGPGQSQLNPQMEYAQVVEGLSGWALANQKPALSPKDAPDPRESEAAQQRRVETNCGAILIVPVVGQAAAGETAQALGIITVINRPDEPNFTDEDVTLLSAMANQVASALTNARLVQTLKRQAADMEAAAQVSRAASSILEPEDLLPQAARFIQESFELYYVGIFLADEQKHWAVLQAGTGEAGKVMLERSHRLEISENAASMIGQAIIQGKAQIAQVATEAEVRFPNPLLPETRSEMALPLISRSEVIGAMTIQSALPNAFSQEDITTLQTMADQLANAIENALLYSNAQRRTQELAAINRVTTTLTQRFDLDHIAGVTLEAIASLFGAMHIGIVVPQENRRLKVIASRGMSERVIRLINRSTTETDYWQLTRNYEALVVEEMDKAPVDPAMRKLLYSEGVRSFAFLPLRAKDELIGALNIGHDDIGGLDERAAPLLRTLADQIALALDNARLFESQSRRTSELARLHDMTIEFGQAQTDLNGVLDLLTRRSMELLASDGGGVWIWHPDEEELELVITYQVGQTDLTGRRLKLGEGLTGLACLQRSPQVVDSYYTWTNKPPSLTDAPPFYAAIAMPMIIQDTILGALVLTRSEAGKPYNKDQQDLVELIANQAASFIANARSYAETEQALARTQALLQVGQATIGIENPMELFQTVVDTIAQVTQADQVLLITLDYEHQLVEYFIENGKDQSEVLPLTYGELVQGLSGWVLREQKPAISPKTIPDPRESDYVRQHRRQAGVGSIVVAPLAYRNNVIGTLTATKKLEAPDFTPQDTDLIVAIASQVSTAIENVELYTTQQKRARQLQAASSVSQAASSQLELAELLPRVVEVIQDSFEMYYVGIFLNDEQGEWAILRAGTGEAGRIQAERGHRLKIGGNSMIGQAIAGGLAQISQEVGEAEIRFRNPLLPDTRSEMALPLITRGQVIGAMTIQSSQSGAFSLEDITTLQTMANELANAINNARLFEQIQQSLTESQTLYTISSVASRSLELEDTLEEVLTSMLDITGFDSGLITVLDPNTKRLKLVAQRNLPQGLYQRVTTQGLEGTLCELVYLRAEVVIVDDMSVDAPLDVSGLVQAGLRSYLGVPLESKGQVLGTLCSFSTQPNAPLGANVSLAEAVGQQVGIAIENARLFEQSRRQNDDLNILNEMGRALSNILEPGRIAEILYEYTSRLMDTTSFFVAIYDPEGEEITFPLAINDNERYPAPNRKIGGGLTDYVLRSGEPLLIPEDVLARMESLGLKVLFIGNTRMAESWLGVPMAVGGVVSGAIVVQSVTTPNLYQERQRDLLLSIAGQAAIAFQNAQLFKQTQVQNLELATLNEMSRVLGSALDTQKVVEITYEYTSMLMDTAYFFFALYDPENEQITFPLVYENNEISSIPPIRKSRGLTQYVIDNKTPLLISRGVEDRIDELGLQRITVGAAAQSWLGVPVTIGEQVLGVITVQNAEIAGMYSERHRDLLVSIARQSAIAILNARQFQETQAALQRTQALYQATAALNQAQTYREIIQALREHTALDQTGKAAVISIDLFDGPYNPNHPPQELTVLERWVRGQVVNPGLSSKYSMAEYPSAFKMMRPDEPVLVEDIATDPRMDENLRHLFLEDLGAKSALFVPLRSRGQWLGYINGIYPETVNFTHEELQQIGALVEQATTAIQALYQLQEIRDRARRERVLSEITARVHSATDINTILRTAAQEVGRALGRKAVVQLGLEPPAPHELGETSPGNGQSSPTSDPEQ